MLCTRGSSSWEQHKADSMIRSMSPSCCRYNRFKSSTSSSEPLYCFSKSKMSCCVIYGRKLPIDDLQGIKTCITARCKKYLGKQSSPMFLPTAILFERVRLFIHDSLFIIDRSLVFVSQHRIDLSQHLQNQCKV